MFSAPWTLISNVRMREGIEGGKALSLSSKSSELKQPATPTSSASTFKEVDFAALGPHPLKENPTIDKQVTKKNLSFRIRSPGFCSLPCKSDASALSRTS